MNKPMADQQPASPLVLFFINVIAALIWASFMQAGLLDFIVGMALGALLLSIFQPIYGRRIVRLISFSLYVLWAILISNFRLAWTVIQPTKRMQQRLDPGIVAIPLTIRGELEIMVLASVITLTPGTLTVDLAYRSDGQAVLYVHNLTVRDPDAFRTEIQETFERRILQIVDGS
ncbi:MAG: Na+/H+ antiporter subunit E [Caldilineaceae bacterium]